MGASGHGYVVADIAAAAGYVVVGFLDDTETRNSQTNFPILGTIEFGKSNSSLFESWVICIGDNFVRRRITEEIVANDPNAQFETIRHPHATIAENAEIGPGSIVMAGAIVQPNVQVGRGAILNTNCSLDHDSIMEDFSSLAPGSVLGGATYVGENTAIGIGATVSHNVRIQEDCVIGAGSVVVRDICRNQIAFGVPATEVSARATGSPYL